MRLLFGVALLAAHSPALAQSFGGGDERVRSITYTEGGQFALETPPGGTISVLLAPGERIESVAVDAPDAFPVTVAPSGDAFAVRVLGTSLQTAIDVRSDRHAYHFRLVSGPGAGPTLVARMVYDKPAPFSPGLTPVHLIASAPNVSWRTGGSRVLRPLRISDDGTYITIEWDAEQPIPAVFTIDANGKEAMVNGYMRDNRFTIDRVYPKLVFRIDRTSASATRIVTTKKARHR